MDLQCESTKSYSLTCNPSGNIVLVQTALLELHMYTSFCEKYNDMTVFKHNLTIAQTFAYVYMYAAYICFTLHLISSNLSILL